MSWLRLIAAGFLVLSRHSPSCNRAIGFGASQTTHFRNMPTSLRYGFPKHEGLLAAETNESYTS